MAWRSFFSAVLLLLLLLHLLASSSSSSSASPTSATHAPSNASLPRYPLHLFLRETSFYNDLVLRFFLPSSAFRSALPHAFQSWLRNYIAGVIVYFMSGGLWCLYIYRLKPHVFFPKGGIPDKEAILMQIWVSMKAIPFYVGLPSLSEFMVEKGWTRCYAQINDVGLVNYVTLTIAYLILVEFGIYWMHKGLHDIKPLYGMLHATHHIYNKQNTLSPFAGLAFHPLDGIIQALPHVLVLFCVPTHFFTHEMLLFVEGVWTTSIHDCIHGKVWPIMGAGYHTLHHTTYRHNYGHYTIWMDWMFGTLRHPEDEKWHNM